MSIAAISSQATSAVRRIAASAAGVDVAEPVRAVPRVARESSHRHELAAAMNQALGIEGQPSKATEQAVFRFAHALTQDLHLMARGAHDGPRAGGRGDWGDLPQRLSTLASAANAPPPAAEMPDTPNPVTTATVAVHIMRVPSSRLLEAFVALQRAMGDDSVPSAPADSARTELADLVRKLAAAVTPSMPAAPTAGSMLDVRA